MFVKIRRTDEIINFNMVTRIYKEYTGDTYCLMISIGEEFDDVIAIFDDEDELESAFNFCFGNLAEGNSFTI